MMNEKIMREILFRGKRTANNEWVEGNYFCDPDYEYNHIMGFDYYYNEEGIQREFFDVEVIPETVGQYTGLTDKNGKKIFEGDIFCFYDYGKNYYGVVKFGNYSLPNGNHIGFYVEWLDNTGYYRSDLGWWADRSYADIVGNIHDNPELLKGGVNNG